MFIVRPKGILGTPKKLARDLGCRTRFYPNPKRPDRVFDLRRDILLMPVKPEHLRNVTQDYLNAYNFFTRNKYGQRKYLEAAGVPVPGTFGQHADAWGAAFDDRARFVVRPLRHSGGRGYRVTKTSTDFIPGQEYLSELYPKKREYRIIFVLGKPVIWMRKKPNDGVTSDAPWGHVNSFFQTINDPSQCKLSTTDCAARLQALDVIRGTHVVAVDILYNRKHEKPYVVLELNLCPALTLDDNRARVIEIIRAGGYNSLAERATKIRTLKALHGKARPLHHM